MASSIASRVPDPTEKCAVWAASPTSTTFPADQRAFAIVGNRRHSDLLHISGCPSSSSSKSRARKRAVSSSLAASIPALRQVSSVASAMKVDFPDPSYW